MRISRCRQRPQQASDLTVALSVALSLLSSPVAAITYDCKHIQVDRQSFDLSPLAGDYSISHLQAHPPISINTTYTLNICEPLKRRKDVPKDKQCPHSTRVCAVQREIPEEESKEDEKRDKDDAEDKVIGVIPIAGEFLLQHGRPLDPKWTRLKTSSSNADSRKEGLRLELHGGQYPFAEKHGRKQRAIIEFLCDRDRTGLEGLGGDEGKAKAEDLFLVRRSSDEMVTFDDDDDDDDDENDDGSDDSPDTPPEEDDGKSLKFIGYEPTSQDVHEDTLRLEWRTKYACEGIQDEDGGKSSSGHWGFFTWFIIIVFLVTASYLIFGSWLNYNRYGARGWDLLPHGDTIRDIPYLLRDFIRRVINTVQGSRGGSRGGYSAV